MARPNKTGLDYFPLDIDFFDDEKITAISGEFGIKGEITVIRLLCAIYRNGYFILWNDLLKFKLLKNLPGISEQLLECIVRRLVSWGFFDEDLFGSAGVLTSKGIQRRYFNITKRRVADTSELPYLLISVCRNPRNDNKYEFLHTETPLQKEFLYAETPQSKVKEIKEDKKENSKEKKAKPQRFVPPTLQEVSGYVSEMGYHIDPERFLAYYESNGWMVGRNRMKSWKAALTNWEKMDNDRNIRHNGKRTDTEGNTGRGGNGSPESDYPTSL